MPGEARGDTFGVTRSYLIEQLRHSAKPQGGYQRQGDNALLATIRQLTDARRYRTHPVTAAVDA